MTNEKTLLAEKINESGAPGAPCPHCGADGADGDGYCGECGLDLSAPEEMGTLEPAQLPSGKVHVRFTLPDGTSREFPAGVFSVGRSDADLTIADAYMSRKHAEITVSDEGIAVADAGSTNGSFVHGMRLIANSPRKLLPGDALKFGQTEITWEWLAEEEATEMTPEPLEETTGDEQKPEAAADAAETASDAPLKPADEDDEFAEVAGRAHSGWELRFANKELPPVMLDVGETVLGRKPGKADIVIPGDGYISGAHAKIDVREDGVFVTDLGSTNGTFIGGEQLPANEDRELPDGAVLRLGETEIRVKYVWLDEPEAEAEKV